MCIVHSQQKHSRQIFVTGILTQIFFCLLSWHRIPLSREFVRVLLFLWFVSVQMPVVTPCSLCFRFPSQRSATSHSLSPSIHPLECHYTKLLFSVELLSQVLSILWALTISCLSVHHYCFCHFGQLFVTSYQTINNRSKYSPSFACPWPFWHRKGKKSLWFTFLPAKLPYHPACKESRV